MLTTEKHKEYLSSLLRGDQTGALQIVEEATNSGYRLEDVYENLMKPALYEVGLLWEYNRISVATEHMATAISEYILNQVFGKISQKKFAKTVVLACVNEELHQVGIKMVGDVFERNGWQSYFLGAGIPSNELIRFVKESKPDMLAISLSVYFNFAALLSMIHSIRSQCPDLSIIVGGQAFTRFSPTQEQSLGVQYFRDLYALEKYLQTIKI